MIKVLKHFVVFYYPGTIFSEESALEIEDWNVDLACEMAQTVGKRGSGYPYGFAFKTRGRGENDLDSRIIAKSKGFYFLGGTFRSREEVLAGTDPKENILRTNMEFNGYEGVVVNMNSWLITLPFNKGDVLLPWAPRTK